MNRKHNETIAVICPNCHGVQERLPTALSIIWLGNAAVLSFICVEPSIYCGEVTSPIDDNTANNLIERGARVVFTHRPDELDDVRRHDGLPLFRDKEAPGLIGRFLYRHTG